MKTVFYSSELQSVERSLSAVATVTVNGSGLAQCIYAQSPVGAVVVSATENGMYVEYWLLHDPQPVKDGTFPDGASACVAATRWLTGAV